MCAQKVHLYKETQNYIEGKLKCFLEMFFKKLTKSIANINYNMYQSDEFLYKENVILYNKIISDNWLHWH